MKDLVSIIIPVYNRQAVVRECIQSVGNQSHQNYEIILIDDGSTDKTLEVCRELAKAEPRIRILEMEHAGVSAARNKGLERAEGEYVFFLDSDDVIHPLLLETLIFGMKISDASIAGTRVVNILEKYWDTVPQIIRKDQGPGETAYHNHSDTLDAVFGVGSPFGAIGGVMMRRDWIAETQFREDLFIGEDFYFIYENLIKGASTVFLKQKWYYCRIHANNSSWNYGFDGFMNRFYRRELVWRNEEKLGRFNYANHQKKSAVQAYYTCLLRNSGNSGDVKKMQIVMKENAKTLLPALTFARKIRCCFAVYMPSLYRSCYKGGKRVRRLLKK